jgi:carbon monoxide dehydrogenase subunit G
MDMTGVYRISLPQATVWAALNDPAILKAAIPGCEELERDSETSFKGRIAAAVGPVRAKFAGSANLTDIDAPNGYTLTGSGSGGAAGMVKGGAKVWLTADDAGTVLHYEAHAQVAGKLAQIGARLVDMAAKKLADEFFQNFAMQLEPVALAEAPVPVAEMPVSEAAPAPTAPIPVIPAATGPVAPAPATEDNSHKRRAWLIWLLAALVIILVVAYLKGLI